MRDRCILTAEMEPRFRGILTAPGWWFLLPKGGLTRVQRAGLKFTASIYDTTSFRNGSPDCAGRSVVGSYRTVLDARKAAELLAAMEPDCPRVARWSDVVKCRRELAAAAKTVAEEDDDA